MVEERLLGLWGTNRRAQRIKFKVAPAQAKQSYNYLGEVYDVAHYNTIIKSKSKTSEALFARRLTLYKKAMLNNYGGLVGVSGAQYGPEDVLLPAY